MVRISKRKRADLGLPVSDDESIPKRTRRVEGIAVSAVQAVKAVNQGTEPSAGESQTSEKPATQPTSATSPPPNETSIEASVLQGREVEAQDRTNTDRGASTCLRDPSSDSP